jgi:uncharacterized protein with PIN domain
MAIYDRDKILAIQDDKDLRCVECTEFHEMEDVKVKIYEERDRNEEEIMVCDLCGKII